MKTSLIVIGLLFGLTTATQSAASILEEGKPGDLPTKSTEEKGAHVPPAKTIPPKGTE